jgi:hypothetical protein
MVCAIRMSKTLLRIVSSFIAKNADFQNSEDAASRVHSAENHAPQPHYSADGSPLKYFFIEYLFHTLALHYKLKVVVAPELREILWIRKEKTQQIEEPFLYHPVKEIGLHDAYRRSKLITASRRDRGAAGKWVLPAYVPARPSRPVLHTFG